MRITLAPHYTHLLSLSLQSGGEGVNERLSAENYSEAKAGQVTSY